MRMQLTFFLDADGDGAPSLPAAALARRRIKSHRLKPNTPVRPTWMKSRRVTPLQLVRARGISVIKHELGRIQQCPKYVFGRRLTGGVVAVESGGGLCEFVGRRWPGVGGEVEFGDDFLRGHFGFGEFLHAALGVREF